MLNRDASKSIDRLHKHLNRNPDARRQFFDMVDRSYLNHLKVMSLSSRYLTFHCHGILNDAIFNRLAELAGANADDHCLRERVHMINKWFVESVLSSKEAYESHLPVVQPDLDVSSKFSWEKFPLYLAVWNMGPIPGKILDIRNEDPEALKYLNSTNLPATGVRRVVHGHTQSFTSYKDKHTALLDQLNELALGLLRASADSGQLSPLEQINLHRETADELFPQLDELVNANAENGIDRMIIRMLDHARRSALLISLLSQAPMEIEDEISSDRDKGKGRVTDADADHLKKRLMDSIQSGGPYQQLDDKVRSEVDDALVLYFRGSFADKHASEGSFSQFVYWTSTEFFARLKAGIGQSTERCLTNLTFINETFSDHSRNYYSLDDKFGQTPEHLHGTREVYLE
jgi:hypothetical protein